MTYFLIVLHNSFVDFDSHIEKCLRIDDDVISFLFICALNFLLRSLPHTATYPHLSSFAFSSRIFKSINCFKSDGKSLNFLFTRVLISFIYFRVLICTCHERVKKFEIIFDNSCNYFIPASPWIVSHSKKTNFVQPHDSVRTRFLKHMCSTPNLDKNWVNDESCGLNFLRLFGFRSGLSLRVLCSKFVECSF